jgi:cytochrome c biogenesis protein CcmG/thiol:disulfide interchange protein DsbE
MIANTLRATLRRAAVLALLLLAGCGSPAPHAAVGRGLGRLPIAAVADPNVAPPTLEGKVSLVNFWGTWCPPCRRELPGLVRLATRLADESRFQLVAVSCNPGPDDFDTVAAETREFLAAQDLDLQTWAFADPVGRDLLFATIGLDAFPTTLLVGPDATVRRVWVGYRPHDEAEIAAAIVTLFKEQPAAR